jgi:hypothetical protein
MLSWLRSHTATQTLLAWVGSQCILGLQTMNSKLLEDVQFLHRRPTGQSARKAPGDDKDLGGGEEGASPTYLTESLPARR